MSRPLSAMDNAVYQLQSLNQQLQSENTFLQNQAAELQSVLEESDIQLALARTSMDQLEEQLDQAQYDLLHCLQREQGIAGEYIPMPRRNINSSSFVPSTALVPFNNNSFRNQGNLNDRNTARSMTDVASVLPSRNITISSPRRTMNINTIPRTNTATTTSSTSTSYGSQKRLRPSTPPRYGQTPLLLPSSNNNNNNNNNNVMNNNNNNANASYNFIDNVLTPFYEEALGNELQRRRFLTLFGTTLLGSRNCNLAEQSWQELLLRLRPSSRQEWEESVVTGLSSLPVSRDTCQTLLEWVNARQNDFVTRA
jgi:hypothetical protein